MKSISKPTLRDTDDPPETLRSNSTSTTTSKLQPMKSFKKLASSINKNDQIEDFLRIKRTKLSKIESRQSLYLNTIVLTEIMQDAEFHFVYGNAEQRQALKDEAIRLLMLEYYENEDVLTRFQETVAKKVSRYGFFRRLCVKMYNSLLKKRVM
jgi:hypothetical protein